MMTRKQYTLKSCLNYVTSPIVNSLMSPMPATVLKSPQPTSRRSTLLAFFCCLTALGIVLMCLSCSALDTAAKVIMLKSEESKTAPTQKDLQWISVAPIVPTAFSIYVLPSLLDSLESASAKTSSISISTNQKNQE